MSVLPAHLSDGTVDTTGRVWTFGLPEQPASIGWAGIERELTRLLRARAPGADRRLGWRLQVDSVQITADSLTMRFTVSGYSLCPSPVASPPTTDGETAGGGTIYQVDVDWSRLTLSPTPRAVGFLDKFCIENMLRDSQAARAARAARDTMSGGATPGR